MSKSIELVKNEFFMGEESIEINTKKIRKVFRNEILNLAMSIFISDFERDIRKETYDYIDQSCELIGMDMRGYRYIVTKEEQQKLVKKLNRQIESFLESNS